MLKRIAAGRTDLVFDWVASGRSATAVDEQGVSLLKWCAYFGDVSAIRFLIAHEEHLPSLGDNLDLNGAAFHGHWRLCQFLIENGADANHALPETGETPLHAAISKACLLQTARVVDVLLAAGGDPNRTTQAGKATGCFMRDVRTRGETPLHRAAAFSDDHVIDALLAAGASREAKDAHGDTPLSWASWHLRPSSILRKLCFDRHAIHPAAHWPGDHGTGWSGMDAHLIGTPFFDSGRNSPDGPDQLR